MLFPRINFKYTNNDVTIGFSMLFCRAAVCLICIVFACTKTSYPEWNRGALMRNMLLVLGFAALIAGLFSDTFCLDVPLKYEKAHTVRRSFFQLAGYTVPDEYSGAFIIGGKRYEIRICDTNRNRRVTDRAKIILPLNPPGRTQVHPAGDTVYLTDGRETEYIDGLVLGDLLLVDDILFDVVIDTAGKN